MTRDLHVLYTVEQDAAGTWRASTMLRPGVGADSQGDTRDEALDELRSRLTLLIRETGVPQEMPLTLNHRDLHVPVIVEQDEDGYWFVSGYLRPDVGAIGQGDSLLDAYLDLTRYLTVLSMESGVPEEMTLTIEA
jgi:predicted RNase H-like HicB family nuclease